jgi:hypothetical protein
LPPSWEIDWSDKKHDICLRVPGESKPERQVIEHRPEAIQAWVEQLRSRFDGAPVAVSVELQEGPIVWALLEYDFIVMFPVKPTTVARYHSAFRPSGAKDDPTDAEVILELLMRHRDKLERLRPERAEVRQLRRLVELRRDLVHDRTRLINRITDALKAYFPQVLSWFGDKEAAARALCQRLSSSEMLRPCAGHRAQRQQTLGALALWLQQVSQADLRRVGRTNHPALPGQSLLRGLHRPRRPPSSSPASLGLQMDPHPFPLLARPHPVR